MSLPPNYPRPERSLPALAVCFRPVPIGGAQ